MSVQFSCCTSCIDICVLRMLWLIWLGCQRIVSCLPPKTTAMTRFTRLWPSSERRISKHPACPRTCFQNRHRGAFQKELPNSDDKRRDGGRGRYTVLYKVLPKSSQQHSDLQAGSHHLPNLFHVYSNLLSFPGKHSQEQERFISASPFLPSLHPPHSKQHPQPTRADQQPNFQTHR